MTPNADNAATEAERLISCSGNNRRVLLVHGPHGCGKTTHATRLLKFFKLSTVLDDWDIDDNREIPPRTLLLTTNKDASKAFPDHLSFDLAMRVMHRTEIVAGPQQCPGCGESTADCQTPRDCAQRATASTTVNRQSAQPSEGGPTARCDVCDGTGRSLLHGACPACQGSGDWWPKAARSTGPNYYRETGIQPWDAMAAWMPREQFIGFLRGNAIKYLARAGRKGTAADARRDHEKAQHYQQKLLEVLETPPCDE